MKLQLHEADKGVLQKYGNPFDFMHFVEYFPKYMMDFLRIFHIGG